MNNPTQPPTNNAVLMTTSPVAWGFHGNYEDFVKNELVPVDNPPADGNCAICRLDFAHQDQGGEEPSDEHVFGMTTQDRILAAAIAAATVEQTPHGNVVQIWKCSHFFHKDCICTWIDGDVAATAARRSCPLCKTELVRYDPLARARAVCREIRTHQETISGLTVVYRAAFAARKKMQDLRITIDRLKREFSHEPHGLSASSREYLRGQLQHLMEAAYFTEELAYLDPLDQLDHFSLRGYSVSQSIDLMYQGRLGEAERKFQSKKRDVKARLQPIFAKLDETEQILKELAEVLYESWGYSPEEVSARLLEDFGTNNPSPHELDPWLLAAIEGDSVVEYDLHCLRVDANFLRRKASWTKSWLKQAEEHGLPPMTTGPTENGYHESAAEEGGESSVMHIEDMDEQEEDQYQHQTEEDAGVVHTENIDDEEEASSVVYTGDVDEQEQDQDELYHELAEMDLGSRAEPYSF